MVSHPRAPVTPLAGSFAQDQRTGSRVATNIPGIGKSLVSRGGVQEHFRTAPPWAAGNADPVFATNASDPRPMAIRDPIEPG